MQMGCVVDGRCRRRICVDLSICICVCVCSLRVSASLERVLLAVPLLCERVPAHNACVKESEQLMCQLLGCKRLATPAPSPAEPLPLPPLLLQLPLAWAVALTPLCICFLIWAHAQSRSEREETTKGPSVPCGCRSGVVHKSVGEG